jgi:hypothetical protein
MKTSFSKSPYQTRSHRTKATTAGPKSSGTTAGVSPKVLITNKRSKNSFKKDSEKGLVDKTVKIGKKKHDIKAVDEKNSCNQATVNDLFDKTFKIGKKKKNSNVVDEKHVGVLYTKKPPTSSPSSACSVDNDTVESLVDNNINNTTAKATAKAPNNNKQKIDSGLFPEIVPSDGSSVDSLSDDDITTFVAKSKLKKNTPIIHEVDYNALVIENTSNAATVEQDDELVIDKTTYQNPVLLQEPFHSKGLFLYPSNIKELSGPYWLSTRTLDFLLKWGIPHNKKELIIVPTTAIDSLLDLYIQKSESTVPEDIYWFNKKQQELNLFSKQPYKFLICSCTKAHFFVISMDFDAECIDGNVFDNIVIYDSIKRSGICMSWNYE